MTANCRAAHGGVDKATVGPRKAGLRTKAGRWQALWLVMWLQLPAVVWSAGGVVGEAGSCMIEIGLYTAHFTVYQSDTSGDAEFCEDLPDTGRTLFVLDYLHGSMKEVPVDFRIIRDQEGWGIFTRWDNIAAITDLDARTVYYQPGTVFPRNQLLAEVDFALAGDYIGIVTAPHPTKDIMYRAVFPFAVARVNRWPWLAVLMAGALVGWLWWRRSHART